MKISFIERHNFTLMLKKFLARILSENFRILINNDIIPYASGQTKGSEIKIFENNSKIFMEKLKVDSETQFSRFLGYFNDSIKIYQTIESINMLYRHLFNKMEKDPSIHDITFKEIFISCIKEIINNLWAYRYLFSTEHISKNSDSSVIKIEQLRRSERIRDCIIKGTNEGVNNIYSYLFIEYDREERMRTLVEIKFNGKDIKIPESRLLDVIKSYNYEEEEEEKQVRGGENKNYKNYKNYGGNYKNYGGKKEEYEKKMPTNFNYRRKF